MQDPAILTKPINELPASPIFKEFSVVMGFQTLKDIVGKSPADLMGNKDFNYVWFGELIEILTGYGLLHLLQPTQGNSRV